MSAVALTPAPTFTAAVAPRADNTLIT
jgi:hypothetical protein